MNSLRCVLTTNDLIGYLAKHVGGYDVMSPSQALVFNIKAKASEEYREWKKNNPSELEIEVARLQKFLDRFDENGIEKG